jgi:hypothetical protein
MPRASAGAQALDYGKKMQPAPDDRDRRFLPADAAGVASDGVRAWLVVRLGAHWRAAVTSLVIDRALPPARPAGAHGA